MNQWLWADDNFSVVRFARATIVWNNLISSSLSRGSGTYQDLRLDGFWRETRCRFPRPTTAETAKGAAEPPHSKRTTVVPENLVLRQLFFFFDVTAPYVKNARYCGGPGSARAPLRHGQRASRWSEFASGMLAEPGDGEGFGGSLLLSPHLSLCNT